MMIDTGDFFHLLTHPLFLKVIGGTVGEGEGQVGKEGALGKKEKRRSLKTTSGTLTPSSSLNVPGEPKRRTISASLAPPSPTSSPLVEPSSPGGFQREEKEKEKEKGGKGKMGSQKFGSMRKKIRPQIDSGFFKKEGGAGAEEGGGEGGSGGGDEGGEEDGKEERLKWVGKWVERRIEESSTSRLGTIKTNSISVLEVCGDIGDNLLSLFILLSLLF